MRAKHIKYTQVYCVVRAKKGKTSKERLRELFSSPIFCLLQHDMASVQDKVQLIDADLAEPNCGLTQADQELLVRCVNLQCSCKRVGCRPTRPCMCCLMPPLLFSVL